MSWETTILDNYNFHRCLSTSTLERETTNDADDDEAACMQMSMSMVLLP